MIQEKEQLDAWAPQPINVKKRILSSRKTEKSLKWQQGKKNYCQKNKSKFSDKGSFKTWMQHDTKVEIKLRKYKIKTILRAETLIFQRDAYI